MNDATMLELEALKIEAMQISTRPGIDHYSDRTLLQDIASRIRALAKPSAAEIPEELKALVRAVKQWWQDTEVAIEPDVSLANAYERVPESLLLACGIEAAPLEAVCARDAADIGRPPGHTLGQPEAERRKIWVRYIGRYHQGFGSKDLIESTVADYGGEAVRMVELRDGEQIVPAGDMLVPMGSVALSAEQVGRVHTLLDFARRCGWLGWTQAELGIEVES